MDIKSIQTQMVFREGEIEAQISRKTSAIEQSASAFSDVSTDIDYVKRAMENSLPITTQVSDDVQSTLKESNSTMGGITARLEKSQTHIADELESLNTLMLLQTEKLIANIPKESWTKLARTLDEKGIVAAIVDKNHHELVTLMSDALANPPTGDITSRKPSTEPPHAEWPLKDQPTRHNKLPETISGSLPSLESPEPASEHTPRPDTFDRRHPAICMPNDPATRVTENPLRHEYESLSVKYEEALLMIVNLQDELDEIRRNRLSSEN